MTVLCALSALFFLVVATTFTSLGVVLPSMVNDLKWSWTDAGLGFTLLGLGCGLSSFLPALCIRKRGVRLTIGVGAAILITGYLALFNAHTTSTYFIATTLVGIGFSFVATVPGTHVLARVFKKQSTFFGIYFTVGGLGGFVGPWIYWFAMDVWNNWRMHWMLAAIFIALASVAAMLVIREDDAEKEHAKEIFSSTQTENLGVYRTAQVWTARQALRTPQFYIIAAAYTSFLLVGISVNSFAVAHLTESGFAASIAVGALSFQALLNALSRAVGGIAGEVLEPKKLLIGSLLAIILGLVGIAYAGSWLSLVFFVCGIGIGYGLTFITTSVLLSNYFGREPFLELFSIINLISTTACFGPVLGGVLKDRLGDFTSAFLMYGAAPVLVLAFAIFMRPPRLADVKASQQSRPDNALPGDHHV